MYYYAGIFDLNRNKKTESKFLKMFSHADKNNCFVFNNHFLHLGYELPKDKYSCLEVPVFYRLSKSITIIMEGSIDNLEDFISKAKDFNDSILELYNKYGISFLKKLSGHFSFVLQDIKKEKIYLYRSRVGLKFLYYTIIDKKIIFSSIMKPMLLSSLEKKINPMYVASYFFLDGLNVGDSTEYKNIYNLMPGNLLIFSKNGSELRDYSFCSEKYFYSQKTAKEHCVDFFKKIQKATQQDIANEKQCSIAFSGGLDTGLLLGLLSSEEIEIFAKTVNFKTTSEKNKDYNFAKKRAKSYHVDHKEIRLKPKQFLTILKEVIPTLDRLTNINLLNSLIIFKLISKKGDIVFSGDGAEEQLGLYNYHAFSYNFDRMINNLPLDDIKKIYKKSLPIIFNSIISRSWEWKNTISLKKYFKNLFSEEFNKRVSREELYDNFLECIENTVDSSSTLQVQSQFPSLFNKILYLDFFNSLVPNKFMLFDICSRLYSVKISLPFASENFVRSMLYVPAFLKTVNDTYVGSKYVERLVVNKFMCYDIAFSKYKAGSDIPFTEWLLNDDFENMIKEVLSPSRIKKIGIFNANYIKKMVAEHYTNRKIIKLGSICVKDGKDHMHKILKLFSFVLWWENNFMNND